VPYKPILKTAIGNGLHKRRLTGISLACIGLCLAILETTLPGSCKLAAEEKSVSGAALTVIWIDPWWTLVVIALYFLFFFVVAHIVCRKMAHLCLQNFDPLVMALSASAVWATWCHEYFSNYPKVDNLSTFYCIVYVLRGGCHVLFHTCVSVMDAWNISTSAKACVSVLYVIAMGFWFIYFRFMREWSGKEICVTTSLCFVPNMVLFIAKANILMFALRLPLTYCFGYEYAVLKGSYFKRQLQSGISDIKCFSSCASIPGVHIKAGVQEQTSSVSVSSSGGVLTPYDTSPDMSHFTQSEQALSEHMDPTSPGKLHKEDKGTFGASAFCAAPPVATIVTSMV